jgi:hypothetical protein
MSYKEKYLKYKNKYLKLKGGMMSENSGSPSCSLSLDRPIRQFFEEEYSNRASLETKTKNSKILRIFSEDGWNILSARGNGLCLIYAIMHGLEIPTNTTSIEQYILNGFKKYFEVEHEESIFFQKSNEDIIFFLNTDNDEELIEKIKLLLNDNNLDSRLNIILKYAFDTNILTLVYDPRAGINNQYSFSYYTKSPETYILNGNDANILVTPQRNVIILNDSGHYYNLSNNDPNLKNDKVSQLTREMTLNSGTW